jgi:U32 family peptidase
MALSHHLSVLTKVIEFARNSSSLCPFLTTAMRNKIPELLAPAGSFECLQAAINAGADAVYFGTEQLNMRAKSINSFALSDLEAISRLCKAHNVRSYLTLNTVMYDHDMQLLRAILQEVKAQGIDAVIASDTAVLELCSTMGVPLHISTQANVSNLESVRFFARFADVVVLARELTLTQVATITREIGRKDIHGVSGQPLKIEVFAHGALCMAISGKCYLSLHEQNASANRGACNQVCRRPYKVTDLETGHELAIDNEYIMSPKDLCTIDILDQVAAAGVDVLKIEGRGKPADYVYTVTRCYKEALQALAAGIYTADKIADWKEQLATVYNRGFWEGYYLGRRLGEWTSRPGSAATEKKIYVGRCTRQYPRLGVSEFLLETGSLQKGDTVMVIGQKAGMVKKELLELRVNGVEHDRAAKGDQLTFPLAAKLSIGDKLYKIVKAGDGQDRSVPQ